MEDHLSNKINKVFVYGTLLQGEPRNAFLHDCELLGSLDIAGELYTTDMGYPAASFNGSPGRPLSGELYELRGDNTADRVSMLDKIEGTSEGLFKRRVLKINGQKFFTYEAGDALGRFLTDRRKIESGIWRIHGSLAKRNPVKFALAFEKYSAKSYRNFSTKDKLGAIHVRGVAPILVTAPHACAHIRMSKLKHEERFTGSLAAIIHSTTGSHALYTHGGSEIDPNFYDESPFKKRISEIVKQFGIRFVLDIHGTTTAKPGEVFPGVGSLQEFLLGNESLFDRLVECSERFALRLGSSKIFPASRQMTVTKFVARELGIPGMQIEIGEELRMPDKLPNSFGKLVRLLTDFLSGVENFF